MKLEEGRELRDKRRRRALGPDPGEATTWFVEFSEGELSQSAREEFIGGCVPRRSSARLSSDHCTLEDASALMSLKPVPLRADCARARRGQCHCPRFRSIPAIRSRCFRRNAVHPPILKLRFSFAFSSAVEALPIRNFGANDGSRRLAAYRPAIAAGILVVMAAGRRMLALREPTTRPELGTAHSHLADGHVELNARSKIRIAFQPHERDIELLEGQALFKVAKDKTPLHRQERDTQVRAVGTALMSTAKPRPVVT